MSEKIKTVVIVDDEFRIAQLIRQLIHWDELNMKCQAILSDGEKAYDEIINRTPDIVMTDIRMPKVDGLDLIKMTQKKGLSVNFIVISGYKEFEYAHRALEYGVEDYLIKPIKENELNAALQKIRIKIDSADMQTDYTQKMQATVKESEKILRKNFLSRMIDNKETPVQNLNNLHISNSGYIAIDVKLDSIEVSKIDSKEDLLVMNNISSFVEELLGDMVEELIVTSKPGLHIYCVMRYTDTSEEKLRKSLDDIKLKINGKLDAFDQYYVTIGVGRKHAFSELHNSINEAYQAVCNRMIFGADKVIFASELPKFDRINTEDYLAEARDTIQRCVASNNKDNLLHYVTQLYYNLNEKTIDCTIFYTIADRLSAMFFDDIQYSYGNVEKAKMNMYIKCQNCNRKASLVQTLKDSLSEYLDLMQIQEHKEIIKPIRLSKDYIEQHFNEKITLEEISALVGLSPAYFSTLFKKETGTNLINYINEIRINHAKMLLQTTDETIAAISNTVGYTDQRYFSKTFHKITGIKPILYRRLHA